MSSTSFIKFCVALNAFIQQMFSIETWYVYLLLHASVSLLETFEYSGQWRLFAENLRFWHGAHCSAETEIGKWH
jgi:hypothetical protein